MLLFANTLSCFSLFIFMFFFFKILSQLFNPISPLSLYSLYFHISLFWIYNLWADGWIKLARQKISGIMGQFGQSLFFAHSSSGAYCWTTWDIPQALNPWMDYLLKAFLCCFLFFFFLFLFFLLFLAIATADGFEARQGTLAAHSMDLKPRAYFLSSFFWLFFIFLYLDITLIFILVLSLYLSF